MVGANYGASEGVASDLMMDWGTFVPLWYLLISVAERNVRPKVVIVTPSREIPIRLNFRFGQAISYACSALGRKRRIAVVASCDQSHVHSPISPY